MYEIFCHHSYFHQLYISTNSSLKESFSFGFNSLWFFVFGAVGFGVWLDEFIGLFFIEVSGDLLGGVSGHSFLLLGIKLDESSSGWCWYTVFRAESWDGVSDTGRPVLEILSFFSSIGLGNSWLFRS